MATIEEIQAQLDAYQLARDDRSIKGSQVESARAALAAAQEHYDAVHGEWVTAIEHENAMEDQLEAMVIEHEPPAAAAE